jgi:hypothetical protein
MNGLGPRFYSPHNLEISPASNTLGYFVRVTAALSDDSGRCSVPPANVEPKQAVYPCNPWMLLKEKEKRVGREIKKARWDVGAREASRPLPLPDSTGCSAKTRREACVP